MSRIEAAFVGEAEVRAALEALGERAKQIELRSSAPLSHDLAPVKPGPPWVLIAALAGAVLGGTAAFSLGAGTALAYPLPTGGMPIVSGPPLAIVTYEGTALGLILATVGSVAWRARLFRRGPKSALAHHLAEGRIVLSIDAGESREELDELLKAAGAVEVARQPAG